MIANTTAPLYYTVVFSSRRTKIEAGYSETAEEMVRLARNKMDISAIKVFMRDQE